MPGTTTILLVLFLLAIILVLKEVLTAPIGEETEQGFRITCLPQPLLKALQELRTRKSDCPPLVKAQRPRDGVPDVKSDRWKCGQCGYVEALSEPIPRVAAGKCVRCGKSKLEPVAM